jgi:hypothetical protein
MRRIVEILLAQLLLLGAACGSEEQTNGKALVIDVYSARVPSGTIEEMALTNWARDLREGKPSLNTYPIILHADYPLGKAFDIANEAQPEEGAPKLVVAGHVSQTSEEGAYKITFSEFGRPPAYSGKTGLTVRPKERCVLMLPTIDLGKGNRLYTVVLIRYEIKDEDKGEKSRFEIK